MGEGDEYDKDGNHIFIKKYYMNDEGFIVEETKEVLKDVEEVGVCSE